MSEPRRDRIAGCRPAVAAVGVVVPAYNEQDLIVACLTALQVAVARLQAIAPNVHTRCVVVVDSCTDQTALRCADLGVPVVGVAVRNVGAARAVGVRWHLERAAPRRHERLWLATTDADTRVDPDWLVIMLRLADAGADAVFGVVDVEDWSEHDPAVSQRFTAAHPLARPGGGTGHPHVHGANLGIRANAYQAAGGFAALAVGEDQDLADRVAAQPQFRDVRSTDLRVVTSARRESRIPDGFAGFLRDLGTATAPAHLLDMTDAV